MHAALLQCFRNAIARSVNSKPLIGQPSQLHDADEPGSAQMSAWRLAIDIAGFGWTCFASDGSYVKVADSQLKWSLQAIDAPHMAC